MGTIVEHDCHCWHHHCRNQIDLQVLLPLRGNSPGHSLPDQSASVNTSKTPDKLLSWLILLGHAWLTQPAWHQQPHKAVPQAPASSYSACTQAKGRLHRRLQTDMLSLDQENLGRTEVGLSQALLPQRASLLNVQVKTCCVHASQSPVTRLSKRVRRVLAGSALPHLPAWQGEHCCTSMPLQRLTA